MTTTRREFIKVSVIGSGALALGIETARAETWKANPWIRIDSDGAVTIIVGKQEMGQGVRTAIPMIIAEELDADWTKIRIEQASTGPEYTRLNTGGSGSIYGSWRTLRPIAATARELLLLAAAARWSVERTSLRAENGFVIHDASGRRAHYGELIADASKVAVPQNVAPKSRDQWRIIGRATKRIDGPDIVRGRAKYGLDMRVPGMRYATIVRPPAVGGSLKRFDATKSKQVRGVRDVVEMSTGVAVVADSTWPAFKGREALEVEWNEGPNKDFDSRRYIEQLVEAAKQSGGAMRSEGDVAKVFASGGRELSANYIYPFYAHAAVEPINTIASVRGDSCEIWSPTQAPNRVQELVAKSLGIAPANVTVHPTLLGGGFGRRLAADYAIEAAELSKKISAPVQVVWTRADDIRDAPLQHATVEAMRGVVDDEGHIAAWSHMKITNPEMTIWGVPAEDPKDLTAYFIDHSWGVYDIPYAIPNIATSYLRVPSPVRYGPWRAVYSPSSVFARESFFDELAHVAKRDPLQMRLDLLADGKTVDAAGLMLERPRLTRILTTLRERSNWGKNLGAGRGQGVACNIYDGETHIGYVAEVTADDQKWRVDRVVCAVDCGVVVNPNGVRQQVESGVIWALGQLISEITIRNGRVEQSNYAEFEVPRIEHTPKIEVHIIPNDGPQAFGMGEPPVPPLVPAVTNAIFAATGRRIRRLPIV